MTGMTIQEVANALGISYFAARQRIVRAGIEPISKEALYPEDTLERVRNARRKGRPPKARPEETAAAMELSGEYLTISDMAKDLEITYLAAKQRLLRAGIKPVTNDVLYDKSAIEAIRVVPGKGRPRKARREETAASNDGP